MKRKFIVTLLAMALIVLGAGLGQAADTLLVGTNLTVGVADDGGMVAFGPGVGFPQGITYTGPGKTLPNDYTLPGTPFEFYSIGVGGVFGAFGTPGGTSNPGGYTTDNLSVGNNLQAHTDGPQFAIGAANLIYHQVITFDKAESVIHISADIFNNNPVTLHDVVYARGMDPDQDQQSGGGFATTNFFVPKGVEAVGPTTGMFVKLIDNTVGAFGVAAISDSSPDLPWETNPYVIAPGGLINGAVAGNPFDYAIEMAWLIGDMPAFTSKQIDLTYQFGVVPVPPSVWLLGSGLVGLFGLRRKFLKG